MPRHPANSHDLFLYMQNECVHYFCYVFSFSRIETRLRGFLRTSVDCTALSGLTPNVSKCLELFLVKKKKSRKIPGLRKSFGDDECCSWSPNSSWKQEGESHVQDWVHLTFFFFLARYVHPLRRKTPLVYFLSSFYHCVQRPPSIASRF